MNWKEFAKKDLFANGIGIELEEWATGTATAKLTIEKRHLNALGAAQGGAIFTLADLALAIACNTHGVPTVSIQTDIRYLDSAIEGDTLTAVATEKLLKKRVSYYHVDVTKQDGTLIAIFDAVCYRKQP